MSINTTRIDRSFSTTEVQDLATAFGAVDTIFDFHQGISPSELNRLLRIGTDNRRFVQEMKIATDDLPWILPGYVDKPDYDTGYEVWFQLESLEAYLSSLLGRVQQTKLIAGHHLMRDSLDSYGNLQAAVHRGISGALPYLNAAEKRFDGQGGSATPDNVADNPVTGQADNQGTPQGGSDPTTAPNQGTPQGGNDPTTTPNQGGNNGPDPVDSNMGAS